MRFFRETYLFRRGRRIGNGLPFVLRATAGLFDNRHFFDIPLDRTTFEPNSLAHTISKEIQFCPANDGTAYRFNLGNSWRVEGELPLDTFTGDDSAHDEHLARSATTSGNDHPVEYLNTFFLAFEYPAVNVDGIANVKPRNFRLFALFFD